MKRTFLTLSVISLLNVACSRPVMQPKVAAHEISAIDPEPMERIEVALPEKGVQLESLGMDHDSWRSPGDYVVVRLSGSYREAPVTLTQRVVGRQRSLLIVDMSLDDGGAQERLRLRIREDGTEEGELVSVARLEGGLQVPFGIAAYEKLMSEYMLSADANETELGSTGVLVEVGGAKLPCVKTAYRVRVGAHQATMSTLSSEQVPWQHVGGEIVGKDGKLLYKAEIVELGRGNDTAKLATGDDSVYDDLVDDEE